MIESGTGFMGFWSEIDADYVESYQEWHNCEHMPERVSIPGFIEGRRYRGPDTPIGAAFFMCYVTAAPHVLGSEAYLAALNRPTQWTQEALKHFRNPLRTLYGRMVSTGRAPVHRPYLGLLRFNKPRESGDLAQMLEDSTSDHPNVAASLFEADSAVSGIMTAERQIYSGGPANQRYLAAFEGMDRARVQDALLAFERSIRSTADDMVPGIYWQEARIRADDLREADQGRERAA